MMDEFECEFSLEKSPLSTGLVEAGLQGCVKPLGGEHHEKKSTEESNKNSPPTVEVTVLSKNWDELLSLEIPMWIEFSDHRKIAVRLLIDPGAKVNLIQRNLVPYML